MHFEEIYKSHWQKIFRLCMGYFNNYELAQDITQETFITVWQQLPRFRGDSGIDTWIFRIASNNCLRQIEKNRRKRDVDLPSEIKQEESKSIEPQIQLLYTYISELPELDRIIISLELEDVKQVEIAKVVGISEANIRVKIHRIKEKLTNKFKENVQR